MKSSEQSEGALRDGGKPSFGIRKGRFCNKKKGVAFLLALLFGAVGMQDLYLDRMGRWTLKLPLSVGVILLLNVVNIRTLFAQWTPLNIAAIAVTGLLCLVWLYDVLTILFKPASDFSGGSEAGEEEEAERAVARERGRGKNKAKEEREEAREPGLAKPVLAGEPATAPGPAAADEEGLFAAEMRATAQEEGAAEELAAQEQSFDLFAGEERMELPEPEWATAAPAAEPGRAELPETAWAMVTPPAEEAERMELPQPEWAPAAPTAEPEPLPEFAAWQVEAPPAQMPMTAEPQMLPDQTQAAQAQHTQPVFVQAQAAAPVPPPVRPVHRTASIPVQHTQPIPTGGEATGALPAKSTVPPYQGAPIPAQQPPAVPIQAAPPPAGQKAAEAVPPAPPPVQVPAQPERGQPFGLPREAAETVSAAARPPQPRPPQGQAPKAKPLNEEVMQGVYDAIAEYDVTQLQIKYSLPVKEARAMLFLAHCTREFGKDDAIVRRMVNYYKLVPQETARVIKTFNTHMS